MVGDVLAEPTANNLVEYLISNEDNESSCEDNPATGEKDKRHHEEEAVTVGVRERVGKLDLEQRLEFLTTREISALTYIMDGIIIPKGSSKAVKHLLPHDGM